MAVLTVASDSIAFARKPTPSILCACNRFKVGGVYATADTAKVIPLQSVRCFAIQEDVGSVVLAVKGELPVAVAVIATCPEPARFRLVD